VGFNEEFYVFPRCVVKITDREIALGEGAALQELPWIREKSTMNERQADVIRLEQCLANACAHRTAPESIKIDDPVPPDLSISLRCNRRDNIVNFEYDVEPIP